MGNLGWRHAYICIYGYNHIGLYKYKHDVTIEKVQLLVIQGRHINEPLELAMHDWRHDLAIALVAYSPFAVRCYAYATFKCGRVVSVVTFVYCVKTAKDTVIVATKYE